MCKVRVSPLAYIGRKLLGSILRYLIELPLGGTSSTLLLLSLSLSGVSFYTVLVLSLSSLINIIEATYIFLYYLSTPHSRQIIKGYPAPNRPLLLCS